MKAAAIVLLAVVYAALGAAPARGQVAQAELRGTIFDEQGGVLPGAIVTARQVETGTVRTVTSSENGSFRMPALPVGTYVIEVDLQGFAKVTREGVTLSVGQTAEIDFKLKLATVAETITVRGESPLVETKKSEISGHVDPKQVEALPINGRNWLNLVSLVPGARGNPGSIISGASGSDMAKYQVDGIDVTNQCCGGTYMSYSQENIAEFQVLTNRFDAEYGRVGGTVINAVTKSGTNKLKGTFFGFFRNAKLDSKNNLMKALKVDNPKFDQRQIGGTVGGPIIKDKMHFFATYENHRLEQDTIPGTGIALFDKPFPADNKRRIWTARVDWQLANVHRLFFRTSKNDLDRQNLNIGDRRTWSNGYTWPSRNHDLSVGETWVLSDRAVHEFRIGFMRDIDRLISNSETSQYSFPSAVLGSPTNSPQHWREFNIEVKNSFSYYVPNWGGEHALKLGFQFFRPRFWGSLPDKSFGAFTFTKDPPSWTDQSTWPAPTRYTVNLGNFSYNVVNPVYGGFFQDNYTVSRKLTLNLGVRYDLETGVKNPDLNNPVDPRPRSIDKKNIAPRLGFAYDLRGDGTTVIRGGAGLYFDKVMLNISGNELRIAGKKSLNVLILNPTSLTDPLGGKSYNDFFNLPTSTTLIAHDYRTPREGQASIGVARQIGANFAIQADYVHIKGVREPRARDINLFSTDDVPELKALNLPVPLPANPTRYGRPNPAYAAITQYETSAKSLYNGLQFGVSKRPSHHFQFQASYTLSWTRNDHEGNRFAGVNNPFNLADEYAEALADQRHRLVTNWIVELPWRIQASTIVFLGSPRTQDVFTNNDPFRSGTGRWLEPADLKDGKFAATGAVVPRNSIRTPKWDAKIDLRLAKTVPLPKGLAIQAIVEAYNLANRNNVGAISRNVFAANYSQPIWSTTDFYQPRQVQVALRLTF